MADGITIQIDGLKELNDKLTALGQDEGRKAIRASLRAGGKVMMEAIRERTPVRPDLPSGTALPVGAMQNDLRVQATTDDGNLAVWVRFGKVTEPIVSLVEFGHRLVSGGYSAKTRKGYRGPGQEVGSVPAHPFVRVGFETGAEATAAAICNELAEQVENRANKTTAVA